MKAKTILYYSTISPAALVSTAFQCHPQPHHVQFGRRSLVLLHSSDTTDADNVDGTTTRNNNHHHHHRRSFLKSTTAMMIGASSNLALFPKIAMAEEDAELSAAATYAYRSAGLPSLRTLGITKLLTCYEGFVQGPTSSSTPTFKNAIGIPTRDIPITFSFPTDWLQIDKLGGGIQYVDQRNGDKLYVLHAILPTTTTASEGGGVVDLKTVPKSWFGDVIFNSQGDVVRSGVVVDGYRVTRSKMLMDCTAGAEGGEATTTAETTTTTSTMCLPRRRLLLKYDTITGSGVQTVERRGLVDAYQVGERDVYMMLTASNAVKFEAKGSKERDTVENIVDSFKIG